MVRRPLRYVVAAAFALSGCSALLDVKDIYFDPNGGGPGTEGGADGNPAVEGGSNDGGTDGATCAADTTTDSMNCGRCGHSCLGAPCTAGVCQAVELASIASAPLSFVTVSDQHIFVSTRITLTTEVGGIWRVSKMGGQPEVYVSIRYAQPSVIVGDKLYFVVNDDSANGTDTGGFYSCPVTGPAPCTPQLIAAATLPRSITVDKGRILYGDSAPGKGLMEYTPPAAPVVFRDGYGFSSSIFVDGQASYYVTTIFSPQPPRAKVIEVFPDAGYVEKYAYDNVNAAAGRLIGDTDSLLFTAYDYQTTTGGVVRRIPRTGGAPCDIGGNGNMRPYGIYADTGRVYWTNLGEGADEPFTNGSLASCERAGCCTTPLMMWKGDGQPQGITGDGDAVYFVTKTKGGIWKIAKP